MKNMARVIIAAITVTAFCITNAGAYTKTQPFCYGNSQAGVSIPFTITANNGSGSASISAGASGDVLFLGKNVNFLQLSASAQSSKAASSADYSVKLGPMTVLSGYKTANFQWNVPLNQQLVSAVLPIMVGPVPVTMSGSVGAKANINYGFSLGIGGVALNGSASAAATGTAAAGVGPSVLYVALVSDLSLANTSLNAYLTATPTKLSGSSDLAVNPYLVSFSVSLMSGNFRWYSYQLANFSGKYVDYPLLKF